MAEPDFFDDGPVKPVRIWSRIGRRPILAAGNSNGDMPMLRYAAAGARRCGCSSCTTTRSASSPTPPAPRTRSSRRAAADWTVVSIKNDWVTVFSERD